MLDGLYQDFILPCVWNDGPETGCLERIVLSNMSQHMAICPYRRTNCPGEFLQRHCGWKGPMMSLLEHVKECDGCRHQVCVDDEAPIIAFEGDVQRPGNHNNGAPVNQDCLQALVGTYGTIYKPLFFLSSPEVTSSESLIYLKFYRNREGVVHGIIRSYANEQVRKKIYVCVKVTSTTGLGPAFCYSGSPNEHEEDDVSIRQKGEYLYLTRAMITSMQTGLRYFKFSVRISY
jgi:hypothetical protein